MGVMSETASYSDRPGKDDGIRPRSPDEDYWSFTGLVSKLLLPLGQYLVFWEQVPLTQLMMWLVFEEGS
jgi:hypothetical protein